MTQNVNDTDTDDTASTTEAAARSAAAESAADARSGDSSTAAAAAGERSEAETGTGERSEVEFGQGERTEAESGPGETTGEDGARSGVEPLSLDHVFGILKNKRRRRVLRFLKETEGTVSLSETAEQIAAQENDKDVAQISSAERKRVYVGLYQCHLPKMDSMDIVSFNKPRGTIDLDDHADEVFEYIDADDGEPERPRHAYSATLSALGLLVLVAAMAVRPATALPVVEGAVALILLSFLTYALVGLRSARAADADVTDR